VKETMLPFIDGVECWHSRSTPETTSHYVKFAKEYELIVTGGSDCHQKPVIMGTVDVPSYVADQFR
jgi:predicted metal-dependent phosphoesterase TrpH